MLRAEFDDAAIRIMSERGSQSGGGGGMGTDGIDPDLLVEMLFEESGSQSRLERVILAHLLANPGCTSSELRAVAAEQGVPGDVNLVLYRALDRGAVIRTGGRIAEWRIALGQLPFGAAPGGSTVTDVLRVLSTFVPKDWSPAQERAAALGANVLRMTAFSIDELEAALGAVTEREHSADLWERWYRAAMRIRSASIAT